MGEKLFGRNCRVTAYRPTGGAPGGFIAANPNFFAPQPNGIQLTDPLRIVCTIDKSIDSEPNTCELKINNLSDQSRTFFAQRPLSLNIEAGYDGTLRQVFFGDMRWSDSTLERPNWTTEIQIADGDRAFRYARVSRSYKKGSSVATAIKEAAASMGLVVDAKLLASPDLQTQFASGHMLQGESREELTRLLAPYGYRWSIQNGRMQILKDTQANEMQAWFIQTGKSGTGVIGTPSQGPPDKTGKAQPLKIKMLLYPELTPGGKIQLASDKYNGIFRLEKVKHTFGTAGDDDWFTEVEAKPIT